MTNGYIMLIHGYTNEGNGIWKISSDGSGKTKLTEDIGAYLNIVDG